MQDSLRLIKGAADILELFERIKKENEKTADSEKGTDRYYRRTG